MLVGTILVRQHLFSWSIFGVCESRQSRHGEVYELLGLRVVFMYLEEGVLHFLPVS